MGTMTRTSTYTAEGLSHLSRNHIQSAHSETRSFAADTVFNDCVHNVQFKFGNEMNE